MRDDFGVFILSRGRPDRVKTLKSLEKAGIPGNGGLLSTTKTTQRPNITKDTKTV